LWIINYKIRLFKPFFFKNVAKGDGHGIHQRELRGPFGQVGSADGHRQRESRDGGVAAGKSGGHQGRFATRHLRRIRRGRRGAAGPRSHQTHPRRATRESKAPFSSKIILPLLNALRRIGKFAKILREIVTLGRIIYLFSLLHY